MRLAVTGGTGLVGRFIVEAALAAGAAVTVMSRNAPPPGFFSAPVAHLPYDLAGAVQLPEGCDALVHAAFSHLPGRYRDGEGNDPAGFLRTNLDGTLRLFGTARRSGVARLVFVSSRAVYGGYPQGTRLFEDMPPRPDTLYGEVKLEAEAALAAMAAPGFQTVSLRATGVYGPAGPGQRHKWQGLFDDFRNRRAIAPRIATEVHGDDLARAVLAVLTGAGAGPARILNASDIVLDRRDLLAEVQKLAGWTGDLPERADASRVSAMDCTGLRLMGWQPGGIAALHASLPAMLT
ncbi:NAD-dependent epimerase/dehydratase family protein [Tropicimonas sp.]|uniref:NAD-dependent epimerase/dehydratase family protein n=1 Tax=Tropicimonas sp. TaxID=2067044 RepID=UPI003A86D338